MLGALRIDLCDKKCSRPSQHKRQNKLGSKENSKAGGASYTAAQSPIHVHTHRV